MAVDQVTPATVSATLIVQGFVGFLDSTRDFIPTMWNFCGMAMQTILPGSISPIENVGSFAQNTSAISGLMKNSRIRAERSLHTAKLLRRLVEKAIAKGND